MRNTFTNIPKEFYIPPETEVIYVADFFAEDLLGGAELTSEAIIKASPYKLFKLHSSSLTEEMLKKHKDKIWIFGNYVFVEPRLLQLVQQLGINYYFFEYDFKPCILRSTIKHELQAKKPCDCHNQFHGKFNAKFMTNAKILFWCSAGQRDKFYGIYPHLKGKTKDVVQASTFYPETILNLRSIRERKTAGEIKIEDRWLIYDTQNWIKGTQDAIQYCRDNNMNYFLIGGVSNEKFIEELSKSKGMVFLSRDIDVGSRTTVEAKLLGCEVIINDFVLPKFEPWFNKPVEEIEQYFLEGPDRFWRILKDNL